MTSVCIVAQSMYDFDPRVRRKAEALVAAGYGVDVLALRCPDGKKRYTLNGVDVRTISLGKKRGSLARYAFEYLAFFLWVLVRVPLQMRRQRYAVVDVNTLPDFLVFAPMVAKWMGAKIVLDMHEVTPEFYMSKYRMPEDSWIVRVVTFVEKISFDFANRVITINEPIRELLIERGLPRSKCTVVMNAVDERRFASAPNPAPDPVARPWRFVMMYHGTLTPIYGLDLAFEAFAIAREEMRGAELWILGDGPERPALERLAERLGIAAHVKLLGQVPPSEIPSWLSRCHAGLLPMRRDVFLDFAFPNKLPEFVVAGKPVLMSRLKAVRHYFSDQSLAYFEPSDPADLAKQMVRLYHDRDLRARLAARAAVEYEPIRWELMKQRYLDLIRALTPGRRAAVQSRVAGTVPTRGLP